MVIAQLIWSCTVEPWPAHDFSQMLGTLTEIVELVAIMPRAVQLL